MESSLYFWLFAVAITGNYIIYTSVQTDITIEDR